MAQLYSHPGGGICLDAGPWEWTIHSDLCAAADLGFIRHMGIAKSEEDRETLRSMRRKIDRMARLPKEEEDET